MSLRLLALLTGLLVSTPHVYGAPSFTGQIYSFDQVMRLTPAKRAQYLRDLAEVVALMEKQQKSMEVADAGRLEEMKAQVAMLLKMIEFMPSAEAVDGSTGQRAKKIPVPERRPDPETTSAIGAAASEQQPANPLQQAVDSAPMGDKWFCDPPKNLECKALDKGKRDELKQQFRNNKKNECITAGNFQPYRNNVPKPGNCSYTYAFPDKNAAQKISCDKGESLCNPLLFCAGVDVDIQGQSQFLLAPLCVKINQDMTRGCMAKFEEATVAGKNILDYSGLKKNHREIFNMASKAKPRACDFSKDLAGYSGVKEKYDSLRDSVQGRYRDLCVGDSAYQAMFCSECEIIGKQIYAMNTKGGYGGCAAGGGGASGGGEKPATEVKPATTEQ